MQENDLVCIMNCLSCKLRYKNPKTLPCGEPICQDCIDRLLSKDSRGIECPFCKQFHALPENGFPPNKLLQKLISKKLNEVCKDEFVDDLKSKLDTIQKRSKTLENDVNMGKDKIKEHCDYLRNDIEIEKERTLQFLNKYYNEFMAKVDNYEAECNKNFDSDDSEFKKRFDTTVREVDSFLNKWSNDLNDGQIDKHVYLEIKRGADECLKKLDDQDLLVRNKLFNDRLLTFKENPSPIKSEIIGTLYFDDLNAKSEKKFNIGLVKIGMILLMCTFSNSFFFVKDY